MTDKTRLGYDKKLCILPFDHRSFFEHFFHLKEPLTPEESAMLSDYKKLIYEGFLLSLGMGVAQDDAAILVDDVYGLDILLDAKKRGYIILQTTEVSGADHFEFEHGDDWQAWIEKVKPDFTKVLVNYNVEGDKTLNTESLENLKKISDYSHENGYKFLIELLVPATARQLDAAGGDKSKYDHAERASLTIRAIAEMQDAGIEPDVWKIEGLYTEAEYENVVASARKDGREGVCIVTLGRNETDEIVELWLRAGARVPGVIGFAVGRTIFLDALLKYRSGECTREQASKQVAERFLHFYNVFIGR